MIVKRNGRGSWCYLAIGQKFTEALKRLRTSHQKGMVQKPVLNSLLSTQRTEQLPVD